ncbi:MAG: hypothetical protein O9331_14345, partial [Acidovorax sp.]|nr:hypothetical protein [Acidovorax sp.]
PSSELALSFESNLMTLSAPDLRVMDDRAVAGVSFTTAVLQMHYKNDPQIWFYLTVSLNDPRGAATDDVQPIDKYSCAPIAHTAFLSNRRYGRLGNGSAQFSTSTWSDFRHFEWRVNRSEFATILSELGSPGRRNDEGICVPYSSFSLNPEDYFVGAYFVGPELHQHPNGIKQEVGHATRNLQIWGEK